ncbi:hypothetical protein NOK12_16370 [Nocardioides sp. OK12]|uniref:hypothetical protein n=1 Tax=Nocardioides sp. OK12 TaxID=2758661 RepID=UPI0021C3A985|nr:hypothetical protein [Nocardioides sp. OK12]GHJ59119.1 hypothetical protein NOK12_16370 [Nocardioides sp. OK12]
MTRNEPALVSGIVAAAAALVTLLVAFGLDLSDVQQNAILGVVAVAAPVIAALVTRSKVTPTSAINAERLD